MLTREEDESTYYEVEAEIENVGTGCRMPLPVRLNTSARDIDDRVWIAGGERVTWKTTSRDLPRGVALDPAGWIMSGPWKDEQNQTWKTESMWPVEVEGTGR
jgi:hypothetical protein